MKRPYLWITLAVVLVYGQILFFKLTFLDDYTYVVENSIFLTYFRNIFRVFTTDFNAAVSGGFYYRPLLAASLIFNASIAGQNPFLFHLTDLLLHLGVCLLLYRFLLNVSENKSASLFGALLFAAHPLLVQTVAWIPARNDSLVTLFILWHLIALHGRKHWQAAISMALALASKETAAVLPLISVLYTWLIVKEPGKYKNLIKFSPVWMLLLIAWYFGRMLLVNPEASMGIGAMLKSIYLSSAAIVQYLGKMFLPVNLSNYPVMADLQLAYGFIALAIIALGILLSKIKNNRAVLFGTAWFFIFLLPSLVRVNPVTYSEVLEHRAYLPMIGIIILVLQWSWFKSDWWDSKPRLAVSSSVLFIFAAVNVTHAFSFRNGLAYWSQAVQTSPSSSFAHKQLGAMKYFANDHAGAEAEYKTAIALNQEETLVHGNLGLIYTDQGRYVEAEHLYLEEIAVNPNYDKVHFNLGYLYWLQKKPAEAEKLWLKTLQINPYHFQAYHNLAIHYYQSQKFSDGVRMLQALAAHGGSLDPNLLRDYQPYLPR